MKMCSRNALEKKLQSVEYRHEPASRFPELEGDATNNNFAHLRGLGCITVRIWAVHMEILDRIGMSLPMHGFRGSLRN